MKAELEPLLLRTESGGVCTLILNRPSARNALSLAMIAAVQQALDEMRDDRSVRAVVLAGAGPAFCAGHDLKEIRSTNDPEFHERVFAACSRMMMSITRLPQPVIARVHGPASAAGCQLVATCDLAVASTEARFATPGVDIGLFCSTPMVALSRAVGRKAAMEMLLTGEMVDAEHAKALGLVNRVVPPAEIDDVVMDYAKVIAAKPAAVVEIGKEAFYRQLEMGLEEAYAYCSAVMTRNMLMRDAAEGIDAFLEKRKPRWERQ